MKVKKPARYYLGADDLRGGSEKVTIRDVKEEEYFGEDVVVLYFREGHIKPVKLSPGRLSQMIDECGDETDKWIGAELVLSVGTWNIRDPETKEKKVTEGVALEVKRVPPDTAADPFGLPVVKPKSDFPDDEVPF